MDLNTLFFAEFLSLLLIQDFKIQTMWFDKRLTLTKPILNR